MTNEDKDPKISKNKNWQRHRILMARLKLPIFSDKIQMAGVTLAKIM